MARGIAIETSGQVGSIAVCENGSVLAEQTFAHGLLHAAQILPILDSLCRGQSWLPSNIEHIYLSIGPGSFTGLRVGVTLAKMLSFATGAQVAAVPTSLVLVQNAPPTARDVITVLDAKRGQVFATRFTRPDAAAPWVQVEPAHLDELADVIARAPLPVHLLGEGLPFHRQEIPASTGVIALDEPYWQARAGAVAGLGAEMAIRGAFADTVALTPLYIRRPEAEEKWLAANAGH